MNNLLNKIHTMGLKASLKDAFAAFAVVMLIPSQNAMAQTLTFAALDQSVTIAAWDNTVPAVVIPPVPETPPTVQEVLLAVCEAEGLGEDCAKHLLGMLWNESSNVSTAIGDGGRARGYFQIWYKLHKIPVSCAEDLVCSAQWSLDYLQRNGYPKYVSYAIQCHNSCNFPNGYAAKALRNGNNLWDKPLEVKQAAPIVLPVRIELAAK